MRILVVEDDLSIGRAIKKGLEQETHAVDLVADGEEGFDLASTEAYDLIILDLMLPSMDGLEMCKQLRQEKNQVSILMLTARGELEDKVSGLNLGADDYLVKPFEFDELLARVNALGRRPKVQLANILVYEDVTLDTIQKTVHRGDTPIKLSKKEYSLLEFLLRHQNQLVTKDQIIQAVWNYDADVLPNTVEVYVGYLRNKIDKGFKNKPRLIQTVRGFGYRLGSVKNNEQKTKNNES